MLIQFRIFLVFWVLCVSCNHKLSKEAFIRWYQTIQPLERETENLRFRIKYFPVELLMMDKNITEQELENQSDKIWLSIDVESKHFFNSDRKDAVKVDLQNVSKLEVTLKDKAPEFKINEYSTGKGVEGRWILGWNKICLREDKLLIKIDDQSIEIPVKEIIPEERPILKI